MGQGPHKENRSVDTEQNRSNPIPIPFFISFLKWGYGGETFFQKSFSPAFFFPKTP